MCHPQAAEARASKEKTIFSSTDTNSEIRIPDYGVHPLGLQAHMATAIISTQFTSPHTGKRMDLNGWKNTAQKEQHFFTISKNISVYITSKGYEIVLS